MSANALINFYTDVLQALSIETDDQGHLTLHAPNDGSAATLLPVEIEGNRLTLPLSQHLKSGDWEGKIAFHPMSEHPLRGQSEVLRCLLRMVRFRISSVISQLLIELMTIAANPESQKELNTRQIKFLTKVPDANAKTAKALRALIEKQFSNILSIYLHKSKDENARREAVVNFPMYVELCTEGSKAFDVELGSIKNKKTIKALFEFLIPGIDKEGNYNAISNSDKAPYFESLLLAFINVAIVLNKQVKTFKTVLDTPEQLAIDLTFEDDMENINTSRWKTAILPLPGNEGTAIKGEKPATTAVSNAAANLTRGLKQPTVEAQTSTVSMPTETATPTISQPQQQVMTPQRSAQSNALVRGGKVSFRELQQQRAMSTGQQQQPMQQQYGMNQPMYQAPPQPMMHQGYNQHQQYGGMQQPMQHHGYTQYQQYNPSPSLAGTGVSTAWNNQAVSI